MDKYGNQEKSSKPESTKLIKDFYTLHDDIKNRSQDEVDKYLKDNDIQCDGKSPPRPVTRFEESSLPKYLVDQLLSVFKAPSAI